MKVSKKSLGSIATAILMAGLAGVPVILLKRKRSIFFVQRLRIAKLMVLQGYEIS